ncbi:hypothetical protein JHK87_016477 [Glycine soja]|nr:hypothetical protein JHK87_016477 [Glycine soja]
MLSLSESSQLYNIRLLDELRDSEHLKKIDIDEEAPIPQSTSSYSGEQKNAVTCLLPSTPVFPCLHELDLSFGNLRQIPDAIGNLCCSQRLDLSGNNFATLPNLKNLSKLHHFRLHRHSFITPTYDVHRDSGHSFRGGAPLAYRDSASTSSIEIASNTIMRTYDVFVSFCGETRNNFTGFLFQALSRKGIDVFKDYKDIRKVKSIAPRLLRAIEGSHIFIFSKDYASSTWCFAFKHPKDVFCLFFMMLIHHKCENKVETMIKSLLNTKNDLEKIKRGWKKCRDGEKF